MGLSITRPVLSLDEAQRRVYLTLSGVTYVAVESESIMGYVTIAAGNIEGDVLPASFRRGLPRYPLPVLRLARLAVAVTAQQRGVGSALLRHVFLLALRMAEELGCVGILVDAKSDAVEFYLRVGFSPLEVSEGELELRPKPTPMFLPLELIVAASDSVPTRSVTARRGFARAVASRHRSEGT